MDKKRLLHAWLDAHEACADKIEQIQKLQRELETLNSSKSEAAKALSLFDLGHYILTRETRAGRRCRRVVVLRHSGDKGHAPIVEMKPCTEIG